ncbi:MAG TPA: hypothetical protein VFC96_02930, partial [Anaerovoracaceae bacterium]|nr:hypothetical protein [Anaerovoracaceae bacterium]
GKMADTRLAMLLKHLRISAKNLADGIHVDPSLVSRWQTGDRILNRNSGHLTNIVSYILEFDEDTGYKNIETFLSYYSPGTTLIDESEPHNVLYEWLSALDSLPDNNCLVGLSIIKSFCETGVIKGDSEKKKALLNFLDVAISLSEERSIYIMIGLDTYRYLEKDPFYTRWVTRLHKVLSCNHKIYFIYNHSFSSFANDLRGFFSLCSSGLYHAYYLPRRGSLTNPFDLCIIEDTFVLTDFASTGEASKPICFSFTDKDILNQLQIDYMNYLDYCQPLNNDMLINHQKIYQYLSARITEDQDVYIYDETPFLFPLPVDLFKEILDKNLDSDEADYALECYYDLVINQMQIESDNKSMYHMIINIETLMDQLSAIAKKRYPSKTLIFPPLLISEKKIEIPLEYYIYYIEILIKYLDNSHFNERMQIKFVNSAYMKGNTEIAFISKNKLFSLAFPYNREGEKPMLFTNPTVVSDTFNYLEEYWANIPDELNNTAVVKSQLDNLVKKIKENVKWIREQN